MKFTARKGLLAGAAAIAVAGTGLLSQGTVGTANAATAGTTQFRLSNFSAYVALICVHSDNSQACSGLIATGKTKVPNIKYTRGSGWKCDVMVSGSNDVFESDSFDRANVKECLVRGSVTRPTMEFVAPNGKRTKTNLHFVG